MAWFAESTVEGFVPSIAGAVRMTRSILQSATVAFARGLQLQQSAAFGVGGHQLHGGHAWAKLSPVTIAIKTALGVERPAAPLFRTGAMAKSQRVRVRLTAMGNGIHFQIHGKNTTWYSRFHQSGYRHVWSGKMVVPRMPIEFTMQDIDWVAESIRNYMLGGVTTVARKRTSLKGRIATTPTLRKIARKKGRR